MKVGAAQIRVTGTIARNLKTIAAAIGEADATREKDIKVAENDAAAVKGKKTAEADRRIYVNQQEAEAG